MYSLANRPQVCYLILVYMQTPKTGGYFCQNFGLNKDSEDIGKITLSCLFPLHFGARHFVHICARAHGVCWEILGNTHDFESTRSREFRDPIP